MTRTIPGTYDDPLDLIWLRCAAQLGWTVTRAPDVYASWDGRDTLTLCPPGDFDPDDSVAQMILHEITHALVQGPARLREVDWGLDNTDDARAAVQEHACHRLQAALTDLYGLRALLAPTTDWRPYWDALPSDALAAADDPAVELARAAWADAMRGKWSAALHAALRATADLADLVRPAAGPGSLWSRTLPRTPVGIARREAGGSCGSCAWSAHRGGHCLAHGKAIDPSWPACVRWERRLDQESCAPCGACCREGFHAVSVEDTDAIGTVRPDLLSFDGEFAYLDRPGGKCVGLGAGGAPWRCAVYAIRPIACRDFEVGADACLEARRRAGISRL